MDIPLTTNLTFNASYLQNNQQQAKKNRKQSYPCPFKGCPKVLTNKNTFNNHILMHNNKQDYPCDTCGKKLNTESSLRNHKTTHGDKIFICYVCDRSFTCLRYLNAHNETQSHKRNINNIPIDHSPYKPDPCITDAKNYSVEVAMKEQFDENILLDAKQNPDKKDIEPLATGFSTNISLTTNLTSNASCLQNNQQQARNNIYKVKKNRKRSYPCPFKGCPKTLTKSETFKNHILMHNNKQEYPCDTCSKKFNTESSLRNHKTTHGDKIFICYVCDQSFTCQKYLNTHNGTQSHKRNINNILIGHSPYKPDPCITDDKNYSVEVAMKEQSILNHESQNIYQDNNKHDPSKLPDSAEPVIQEEDCLSDTEKYFNENNLLDIEIRPDEDVESLTAGLNYDKIVAHYL
jgi:uncharacterized CHY-type Zn-finger protein